jgi:hypothetical protein
MLYTIFIYIRTKREKKGRKEGNILFAIKFGNLHFLDSEIRICIHGTYLSYRNMSVLLWLRT